MRAFLRVSNIGVVLQTCVATNIYSFEHHNYFYLGESISFLLNVSGWLVGKLARRLSAFLENLFFAGLSLF